MSYDADSAPLWQYANEPSVLLQAEVALWKTLNQATLTPELRAELERVRRQIALARSGL